MSELLILRIVISGCLRNKRKQNIGFVKEMSLYITLYKRYRFLPPMSKQLNKKKWNAKFKNYGKTLPDLTQPNFEYYCKTYLTLFNENISVDVTITQLYIYIYNIVTSIEIFSFNNVNDLGFKLRTVCALWELTTEFQMLFR
jgi:hypothetical protein